MFFKSHQLDEQALDDIQGVILRLYRMAFGKYVFLHFNDADHGRQWIAQVAERVTSVAGWDAYKSQMTVTWNVGLTYPGLQALGVPAAALATFPREFREGIATPERSQLLGDTGECSPAYWDGGLGTGAIHAMLLFYAADAPTLQAADNWHGLILRDLPGVVVMYEQDAGLLPDGREHFGYRDGIGQPAVEGSGVPPLPGQGRPVRTGEFILGYTDESGHLNSGPQPEALGRNGSFAAFRKLQQNVAAFRAFLRAQAQALGIDEELLAAKLVGRWRSGAPLVLAPEKDDPELGADPMRNNNFSYAENDPEGLYCPMNSHIRRGYGRDVRPEKISNVERHRILRGGMPYGPPLPDGAPDDGADRGLIFLFYGASIERQFEFVQSAWINDGDFLKMETDKDPLVGSNDGTTGMIIPWLPVRYQIHGIPRFVNVRGGEYLFMPSRTALNYLANLSSGAD
jgi:Dyp-type peroxidase family